MDRVLRRARLLGYPAVEHPAFAHPHLPYYQCGERVWRQAVSSVADPSVLLARRSSFGLGWTPVAWRLRLYVSGVVVPPKGRTVLSVRSLSGSPAEVSFLMQALMSHPPSVRWVRERDAVPSAPAPVRRYSPPAPPPRRVDEDDLSRPVDRVWLMRYRAVGGTESVRTVGEYVAAVRRLAATRAFGLRRLLTGVVSPARWANEQVVYLAALRRGFPATDRVRRGEREWLAAIESAPAGGLDALYERLAR